MKRNQPDSGASLPLDESHLVTTIYALDMPPSANRMWRVRRGFMPYLSEEYAAWKATAALDVRSQRNRQFDVPVRVSIRVPRYHASADLDNRIKPILDALQAGGAITNDKLVHKIEAEWLPQKTGKVIVAVLRASTGYREAA